MNGYTEEMFRLHGPPRSKSSDLSLSIKLVGFVLNWNETMIMKMIIVAIVVILFLVELTEQKLLTHARKLVTVSPASSLQQISKFGSTIISEGLSFQTLPYLKFLDDVILRSFSSVR